MQLIKIAIVIFIIYLVYTYWRDNISPQGVLNKEIEDVDNTKRITAEAKRISALEWNVRDLECNSRYMEGMYEWTDVAVCKQVAKAKHELVDWRARAKANLGL